MLCQFVKEYEQQYEKGSTIHLILHLCDCVAKFGPLWVYWCFPFEKILGYYSQFVFSTKNPAISFCIAAQLCEAYTQVCIPVCGIIQY